MNKTQSLKLINWRNVTSTLSINIENWNQHSRHVSLFSACTFRADCNFKLHNFFVLLLTFCKNRVPKRETSYQSHLELKLLATLAFSFLINNASKTTFSGDFFLHDSEDEEADHNSGRNKYQPEVFVAPYPFQ